MDVDTYLLSAILGCILAWFCIMGWRRLIPIILVSFCLSTLSPAQSYDSDNDVPAINEVRDAIQYQMSVLQYELGLLRSTTDELVDPTDNIEDYTGNIESNTSDLVSSNSLIEYDADMIRQYTQATANNTYNIESNMEDLVTSNSNIEYDADMIRQYSQSSADSNYWIKQNTASAITWFSLLQDRLMEIRNKQGTTNNKIDATNTQLTYNHDRLAEIKNYTSESTSTLADIFDINDTSLSELQDLTSRTYDSDDDVESINEVRDAVLELKGLLTSINTNIQNMTSGSVGGTPPTFQNGTFASVKTFDEAIEGKADEINLNESIDTSSNSLKSELQSFGDLAPDLTAKDPIPVIANMTLVGAGPIGNIQLPFESKMNTELDKVIPVVYPIFTSLLIGLILLFTYNRTASMIAS